MIKLVIVVLVIYSIVILFFEFGLSLGNQSPYQEKQLTVFNFAIPCLITLGFMLYASILLFKKPIAVKSAWIILCFVGILEIISVKMQVEFFIWAIGRKSIEDIIPILTGIIMIIYVFFTLTKRIFKDKKN